MIKSNLKIIITTIAAAILIQGIVSKTQSEVIKNSTSQLVETSVNKADTVKNEKSTILVTFIELGSVNCIPCKMMQPVMKGVEEKYGKQVKIIFYDVWTEQGKPFGAKYEIRAIPTQVFLDKDGKEYYRHEGYFPEEELVKILQMKGVK